MKAIIYLNKEKINEFEDLEDAYSFTFFNECDKVEVLGVGVYSIEEFQTAFSNDEF